MIWLTAITLTACAPAGQPARSAASRPADAAATPAGPPKTLVIAQKSPIRGYAPWFIAGSGRVLQYTELHSNMLASIDTAGNLEARLAERLPSLDDGTITLLPDGRMRTVWNLRPNVKWHDGAPFVAADVMLGWRVAVHPEIPVDLTPPMRLIDTIETPDSQTAIITFKTPLARGLELGYRELYPLPSHLLAEAFEGDKDAFMALPIWSTEYVHTGPFRVVDFGLGEEVVLERFDDYFRGRPKLNAIVIRIIRDENSTVSSLLAGAVDMSGELGTDLAANLRDGWKQNGGGWVFSQQGNWRMISIQFSPEWGGPRELQTDVRLRRALLGAIDRDAIRAVVSPGFDGTEAETFLPKSDPRSAIVGKPFGAFHYDPAAATRDMGEGNWRRGPDGRLLNASGAQVQLNLRTTSGYDTELAAVAGNWRELGIDVTEEITPPALARNAEYVAKFPNLEITAQGSGESSLNRFDSRLRPTAQNRFAGSNGGSYGNPRYDELLDHLYASLRMEEQAAYLRQLGEILAIDLPALSFYFTINALVGLKHVKAGDDFATSRGPGQTARNSHLWDRE